MPDEQVVNSFSVDEGGLCMACDTYIRCAVATPVVYYANSESEKYSVGICGECALNAVRRLGYDCPSTIHQAEQQFISTILAAATAEEDDPIYVCEAVDEAIEEFKNAGGPFADSLKGRDNDNILGRCVGRHSGRRM